MDANERRTLFVMLERMTIAEKIEVAAAAQLVAEREARFCRECGRRVGLHHAAGCTLSDDIDCTVHGSDTPDVAEAIERRLIQLRSGQDIPTRHELTDIPVLKPIAAKVRAIRPDLWND